MALDKSAQATKWTDIKARYCLEEQEGVDIDSIACTVYTPKDPDSIPLEKTSPDYLFVGHQNNIVMGGIGLNGLQEIVILGDHTLSDVEKTSDAVWKEWTGA